ncbi:LPP20 family lipoprotein [Moritella viscosa]|uniref:Uncharacterized protein n=1 Tax=Moritella viscosa TaxID=80854 RepID=A0A090I911_9GAMM|nr:LPP20 family lipoprotein [Moritella viscosa]CED58370.1 putative lipoprotein [Moritella viscosa]SGY81458.1 Putative uncharacterized protein [Moritella viscosa]SGY81523.1 Putative uncharacterized protein [Moritella viscosa]SGY81535.1 Putative uncharacterized protein [Moritella viscosa]SGY81555.1 Putative uncharacterized protein [Moritella viscosa]
MKIAALKVTVAAGIMALLSACSSQTSIDSDLGVSGAPDWVNIGTQAVENDSGRLLHGVGMSNGIADESLQKSVADNRARAEIARILATSVDAMQADYTAAANGEVSANVEREIKAKTKLALNGVKIIGRWKNPDNGDIYAFAELDLSDLEAAIKRAAALAPKQ